MLLAAGLVSHGVEVHCYCHAATRTADVPGVTFHHVPAIRVGRVSTSSRFSHPLERASFALAATRALRRDRHLFDVVDVRQTAAWEHDVVTVNGVVAAMQRRWPDEAGRTFRAARLRAAAAPVLRPQIGIERGIQRLQLRRGCFRRVIAVTGQVRGDLVRALGVAPDLIDVIPPPIELDRLAHAKPSGIRKRFGLHDGVPLVLFVGHAFQRKGLDRLLEALPGVPGAHVLIVGDGDRSVVAGAIEKGELARRVHFVGRVEDPERYYAEADLLVLPTRSDPWGIPMIEAMAAGVPVIGTKIAGAAQVVADADAGIILSDESPLALREVLHRLIGDPALRQRMGERGREAAARFGAESHAATALETYRRAMDDAHSRRH